MFPNRIIFIVLCIASVIVFASCGNVSDSNTQDTIATVSELLVSSSIVETEPILSEDTTPDTTVSVTETHPVTEQLNNTEIEYSFYATIDSVNRSHNTLIVMQTNDVSFSTKGSRFSLHITEETKLTAADGTEISIDNFDETDKIGVIIDGLIAETDPATPERVTMITMFNS
jgi:hypothetical protein